MSAFGGSDGHCNGGGRVVSTMAIILLVCDFCCLIVDARWRQFRDYIILWYCGEDYCRVPKCPFGTFWGGFVSSTYSRSICKSGPVPTRIRQQPAAQEGSRPNNSVPLHEEELSGQCRPPWCLMTCFDADVARPLLHHVK